MMNSLETGLKLLNGTSKHHPFLALNGEMPGNRIEKQTKALVRVVFQCFFVRENTDELSMKTNVYLLT